MSLIELISKVMRNARWEWRSKRENLFAKTEPRLIKKYNVNNLGITFFAVIKKRIKDAYSWVHVLANGFFLMFVIGRLADCY